MQKNIAKHPLVLLGHRNPLFLSLMAGLAVAIAAIILWSVLDRQERMQIEHSNISKLSGGEALLRKDMGRRVVALTRDNLDLGGVPSSLGAARRAGTSGESIFTPPVQSRLGGHALDVYVPISAATIDEPLGCIGGRLIFEPLLETALPDGLLAAHELRISVAGQPVYSSLAVDQNVSPYWSQRRFNLYDQEWTLSAAPEAELMDLVHMRFLVAILIGGSILSILVALAVYFSSTAFNRALEAKELAGRLSTLFENLPGIAYRCENDPAWPMLFISVGCEQLTGYAPAEFVEKHITWQDIIHPEDREHVWRDVQAAIAAGETFDLEYRIITVSDEERWMWDRGRVDSTDEDGNTILEGFISNITNRKRAEAETAEVKGLSAKVIHSAMEAIVTADSKDRIETFNPAAEKIYGYERDEIRGKKFEILLPHDLRSEHRRILKNYQQTGVLSFPHDKELQRSLRKDGSEFPNQFSVSGFDHQGEKKFVSMMRDMSEQNAASEEAQTLREDLAHVERLHNLGEMASGLAHELNQPLTAISNYMSTARDMLDDLGPDTKVILKEAMDEAASESVRAGNIVRRLREFISKGQVNKQIHTVEKLIEDASVIGLVGAREKGVDWSIDIAADSYEVLADSIQIQQVMVNLMRNAIDAMSDSPVKHLTISAKPDLTNNIEISVEDTGSGISDDFKDQLFTAFASTKSDGMGLGLSICKTIIEDHGGRISVEKGANGGSIFRFTLLQVPKGVLDE